MNTHKRNRSWRVFRQPHPVIVMPCCPNCGSFDIQRDDAPDGKPSEYRHLESYTCRTCAADWVIWKS